MLQMLSLKLVDGPSSGISETTRDEVDARELSVGTDDFRETREVVDVRADTRPGILSEFEINAYNESNGLQLGFDSCRQCQDLTPRLRVNIDSNGPRLA